MHIAVPSGALAIINRLSEHGYRADIVGGCVRDAILGRDANDFDITTSAPPDAVKSAFSDLRVIETGIAHGTLTVISDGAAYEVTTYRIDGKYTDGRHPDSVSFARDIADDLSRRDFTVNAMAYSYTHGLTDLFGGVRDIEERLIRTVGDPYRRFTEDALRILRAIRFSSVLGFKIEEGTSRALRNLAQHLSAVSKERIYAEWIKLLAGDGAYSVINEYKDVIAVFLPMLRDLKMPPREGFERASVEARFASLFALTLGDGASEAFLSASTELKTDKRTRELGRIALKHLTRPVEKRSDAVKLISDIGADAARLVLELKETLAMPSAYTRSVVDSVLDDGTPYRITDLAIDGTDLAGIGIVGRDTGRTLAALLGAVISSELKNEKESLLFAAKTFMTQGKE